MPTVTLHADQPNVPIIMAGVPPDIPARIRIKIFSRAIPGLNLTAEVESDRGDVGSALNQRHFETRLSNVMAGWDTQFAVVRTYPNAAGWGLTFSFKTSDDAVRFYNEAKRTCIAQVSYWPGGVFDGGGAYSGTEVVHNLYPLGAPPVNSNPGGTGGVNDSGGTVNTGGNGTGSSGSNGNGNGTGSSPSTGTTIPGNGTTNPGGGGTTPNNDPLKQGQWVAGVPNALILGAGAIMMVAAIK